MGSPDGADGVLLFLMKSELNILISPGSTMSGSLSGRFCTKVLATLFFKKRTTGPLKHEVHVNSS
jgi:hypothetical protein